MKPLLNAAGRGAAQRRGAPMNVPRALIVCGIVASLLYAAMNAFVPPLFPGYSSVSQTVSELSALGAPTRPLWLVLGAVYAVLTAAFGYGVWLSASGSRALRVAGALMIANGVASLYWPPMHPRGGDFTLTDGMHILWAAVSVVLMTLAIGFGAAAFGARFRGYSITTLLILLVFGALTGIDGPRIAANLPTPWVGIWERVSIAAFLLWVCVLASVLLRRVQAR
jgi:hypothetical protein